MGILLVPCCHTLPKNFVVALFILLCILFRTCVFSKKKKNDNEKYNSIHYIK